MAIIESSITLNFPDNNYFRFEECEGYKKNQSHFKEMDACWYDNTTNILYLVELKDWSVADLSLQTFTESRIWDLVKKSVDSLSMLTSVLLAKPYSEAIKKCIPFTIDQDTKFKFLSIIHCKAGDEPLVATINQEYKVRFKSYATLFDISFYSVLTHDQAIARLDWVS